MTLADRTGSGDAAHLINGLVPLWHAFRPDDGSGTADLFASLLGLTPAPSNWMNHGFGVSPYCNALNRETSAGNFNCGKSAAYPGGFPHDQFTGAGGIPDPQSVCPIGFMDYASQCVSTATGQHRRPPVGT